MEQTNCQDPAFRIACAGIAKSALSALEGKWKLRIISELMGSDGVPLRFSQLERAIVGITQKVLIQQLKELQSDGIVLRTVYPEVPPKVEYSLTGTGIELKPAVAALIAWQTSR